MADHSISPAADFAAARAAAAAAAEGSSSGGPGTPGSQTDAEHLANFRSLQEVIFHEAARQALARYASRRIVASTLESVCNQLLVSMATCKTAGTQHTRRRVGQDFIPPPRRRIRCCSVAGEHSPTCSRHRRYHPARCHLNTSDDRVVESCLEQPSRLGRTLACSTRHYDGRPMARPDAI